MENQASNSIREVYDRIEVIDNTLREVRSNIDNLSKEQEEFLSYRLFKKAKSILTWWILVWTGAALFFIGLTGVVSYIKVIEKTTEKFSASIMPKLENELREHFLARVNQVVDRESADLSARMESRIQEQLQSFAKQLGKQLDKPKIAEIKATTSRSVREGWAYMGHFENGTWITRYFKFPKNVEPSSLVQKHDLEVSEETGALNVRKKMPNFIGQFAPVVDTLKAGSKVEILEIEEWGGSGYMWARIRYQD